MDKNIKVSQKTVDSMKQMGMAKAIERANSGGGDSEFVEAAKRFYGNRIKGAVKKIGGPRMQATGPAHGVVGSTSERKAVIGEAAAKRPAIQPRKPQTPAVYKGNKASDPDFQKPFGKNETAL